VKGLRHKGFLPLTRCANLLIIRCKVKILNTIRENIGLKIGVATAFATFLLVLLLVLFFGAIQVPLISKFSVIQILLVLAILIAAISILVVSITTTFLIQRPLNRLMSAIQAAEAGDLKTRSGVSSHDEIGQVATQFNEMLEKINQLESTKLDAERKLTKVQEELKYKQVLEEKAQIISSTNLRLEESLKELSVLYNISQAMTGSIDPEELCNLLGDVIVRNVGIDDFAILLINEETQKLEVITARGFKKNDQVRTITFDLGEGIIGQAAKNKQPIYIPDTSKDPLYLHYKGAKPENGSFLCLPVVAKNFVLGAINFSRKGIDAFTPQEIRLLTTITGQVSIALENARLYSKTKELSLIDDLTRVYNRRHFHSILEMECKRAKRFQRPLSLLMIDVDHFKKFNDSFGHIEGDHLLVELAAIFASNLREVDTVARYGGEEFGVILPNTSVEDAEQVGSKLKDLVQKMGMIKNKSKKIEITVSVGVSTFFSDSNSVEDLINHADIALYKAKAKGRNRVIVYQEKEATNLRIVDS